MAPSPGDGWLDRLREAAVATVRQITFAAARAANAFVTNNALGIGRTDVEQTGLTGGDAIAYQIGQKGGDALSTITGVGEVGVAGTGEIASLGGATPLAVPLAVHGTATAVVSVKNLISPIKLVEGGNSAADKAGTEGNPHPTSRAARRDAMRQEGIPTSQQPESQTNTPAGTVLDYVLPKPGGGTQNKQVQQQLMDRNHGPHWEAGTPKPGGQVDPAGRNRLKNDKSKAFYLP